MHIQMNRVRYITINDTLTQFNYLQDTHMMHDGQCDILI